MWLVAGAVVVAIYSTLGLARTLAEELRNRELIDAAFAGALVLIGAAIVTLGLKTRAGSAEIGVALGAIAVYFLAFLRMASPEERTHLIEYGVLAVLVFEALTERAVKGKRVPAPALLAALLTALVGVLDESIQALIPSRVFDPVDILFNVLAAITAVGALVALRRARLRRSAR